MKELEKQVRSIKLECPSCGAGMEVNEDETRASCPYCGYEMILETRDVYREEYERRRARAQAEEEAQQARTKAAGRRKMRAWGIAAAVIAAFMLIGALIPGTQTHQLFFPIEADPFAELKVTFSGDDGEGKVQVKSEAPGELREIEYEVAPATGLRNGDVVEIRAKRLPGYRFSPSVKEVTVEGLPMWVDATADLSEDHLAQLHANTERLIREEWEEVKGGGGLESYVIKPYRLYLFTADDPDSWERNYLYDTYVVEATKTDGEVLTVYEACRYDTMKVLGDGSLQAHYGTLLGFHLGYLSGFSYTTSFSGWFDAQEMEADLRSARDGCTLRE